MSYSKVRMANTWCPSWFDGSSDSFRWDHFIAVNHIIRGHGRVFASNNPDVEAEWEVVLERSFPLDDDDWNISGDWQGSGDPPPFQTDTRLKEYTLDTAVVDKRYVKFQVLTWHGSQGGLQYFDIVRTPRLKTSGEMS